MMLAGIGGILIGANRSSSPTSSSPSSVLGSPARGRARGAPLDPDRFAAVGCSGVLQNLLYGYGDTILPDS